MTFRVAGPIEEHVVGLEVAVLHPLRMHVREGRRDLASPLCGAVGLVPREQAGGLL